MPHPMQEIVRDANGTARFKVNEIVRYLLRNGPNNLEKLVSIEFSQEDWEQFAQLIGYSVSGFGDLSYASESVVSRADKIAARL